MGSLNVFHQYVSKILPKEKEIHNMEQHIQKMLEKSALPEQKSNRLYGIGGTARAAMRIINDYYGKNRETNVFTCCQLYEITEILTSKNKQAKKLMIRNCPDRIHTMIPGILIMKALCEATCKEDIYISKYGVREGYLCHKVLKNTI